MESTVNGHLDLRHDNFTINGWLAVLGESRPRRALVRIDDMVLDTEASLFRADLEQQGINNGRHAFSIGVPPLLVDGQRHQVALIDAESGQQVHLLEHSWGSLHRPFSDLRGFLQHSLTQPIITGPFSEQDRLWLQELDSVAHRLCQPRTPAVEAPLVSVVMPAYNRSELVGPAIRSVLDQQYPNFELIVVDDGSTDDTALVVSSFRDPRVKLLTMVKNSGQSAARNTGLRAASGSIIAYLDSDNRWDSRYLAAVVGAFLQIPEANAIATGQLLYWGEHTEPLAIRYGHLNVSLLENRNFVDLNSFAHKKECISKVGAFDENLRRFVDYDFVSRIVDLGNVWSVPAILTHYYFGRADDRVSDNEKWVDDLTPVNEDMLKRRSARLSQLESQPLGTPVALVLLGPECPVGFRASPQELTCYVGCLRLDSDEPARAMSGHVGPRTSRRTTSLSRHVRCRRNIQRVQAFLDDLPPNMDILLLQNGITLHAGAVQALQRVVDEHPDAGAAVPRLYLTAPPEDIQPHVPYADPTVPVDISISMLLDNPLEVPTFHDGSAIRITTAPAVAAYLRRDVFNRIVLAADKRGLPLGPDLYRLIREETSLSIYYAPDAHASIVPTSPSSPDQPSGPLRRILNRLRFS